MLLIHHIWRHHDPHVGDVAARNQWDVMAFAEWLANEFVPPGHTSDDIANALTHAVAGSDELSRLAPSLRQNLEGLCSVAHGLASVLSQDVSENGRRLCLRHRARLELISMRSTDSRHRKWGDHPPDTTMGRMARHNFGQLAGALGLLAQSPSFSGFSKHCVYALTLTMCRSGPMPRRTLDEEQIDHFEINDKTTAPQAYGLRQRLLEPTL